MKDFKYEETEEGSGQGSVCSPVIANIYMHYVLLWWFEKKVKPQMKGYAGIVRAATLSTLFVVVKFLEPFLDLLQDAVKPIVPHS